MTDEQIIKALKEMGADYEGNFSNAVLDLITRQQAEIEWLKAKNLELLDMCAKQGEEAIKGFAERLKEKVKYTEIGVAKYIITKDTIDNLVKEMVGDSE